MRLPWLFTVLAFAVLGSTALAVSVSAEIVPGSWTHGSANVSSERLANGDIKFSVTIAPNYWDARYGIDLGSVHITDHGESSRGIRGLPADRNAGIIKCVFSVTQKELEDPDLCFRLVRGGDMWIFMQFIRLRKFLPP